MKNPAPPLDEELTDDRQAVLTALGAVLEPAAEQMPVVSLPVLSGEELITAFIRAAEENAASTVRLQSENMIPHEVLSYLQRADVPPELVCTPEWAHLDWRAAGITAHWRAPQESDVCGITGITAAAAESGALLVESSHPHQLTASLLPPHHIAVLSAGRIYSSLAEVFAAHLSGDIKSAPRARNFISGPSRTADIEQTLTLGAHGPIAVHVILL